MEKEAKSMNTDLSASKMRWDVSLAHRSGRRYGAAIIGGLIRHMVIPTGSISLSLSLSRPSKGENKNNTTLSSFLSRCDKIVSKKPSI